MKRRKKAKRNGANGSIYWQGSRYAIHQALWDKFYEKAAKALDDPEVDREIALATLPHLERALERIREMMREQAAE